MNNPQLQSHQQNTETKQQLLETIQRGLDSTPQIQPEENPFGARGPQRQPAPRGRRGSAPFPGKSTVSTKDTLKKLLNYIRPVLPAMTIAIIAAITGVILNIISPQFLAKITNEIQAGFTGDINMDAITRLMWISIAFIAGSWILSLCEGILMVRSTVWLSRSMRSDLDRKIDRLPLAYLDKGSTGDTLSRVTNDVDSLQQTLNSSFASTVTGIVTLLGSAVMMFITDWRMAIAAILSSLLGVFGSGVVLTRSQKYFIAQQQLLGNLNGHVEETLSGHNIIRAYNAETRAREEFAERNEALYNVSWKSTFFSGLMMPFMTFIGNLGYVVVCIVGAILVLHGQTTFGAIVAFIVYVRQFTNPLGQLAQSATAFQSASAAGGRVFEFLEAEELSDESHKQVAPAEVHGKVEFKDVRFSYDSGHEIIHGFTATVQPGQKVAIVGPTGAGKTTLVNLLMRFYEVDSGEILIDNVPLSAMTREQVNSLFAMVLQDTWVFEGTLRENLIYGAENVSEAKLERVIESVGLDEMIRQLPHGYETVLSDQTQISAGQKQLVTIARAMIANKPLLILDEATSSVDTRTELLIQRALTNLAQGKTSFVIAHRLSTIRDADVIFAMKDGDIVESGSHQQLLAAGGFYADLYNSQFSEKTVASASHSE